MRESAESTKLRIVYDASARAYPEAPSLNDCLNAGPPLQNRLWDVLVRMRFHPVALTGDLKQAFLQVRIKQGERDALRFHWKPDIDANVETLRFTRALFGLTCSPFLLGVIEHHLESWKDQMPTEVNELCKSMYVDDLISGKTTVKETGELKQRATEIFQDATFTLHKWHSNKPALEEPVVSSVEDVTYAKRQLGTAQGEESSSLGLSWQKTSDSTSINIPSEPATPTKRGTLQKLARIYDPLGLVSPQTLQGKLIYREMCQKKVGWDVPIDDDVKKKLFRWEQELSDHVSMTRSLVKFREEIESIELHVFGDASGDGVSSTVYVIVRQPSGVSQGLVAAKLRLAKQCLTIPRLELVSAHMAVNLVSNVERVLEGFPVTVMQGWLDSTDRLRLNLQPNAIGILECRGCIQGRYPIYLSDASPYTTKLVEDSHLRTLHGGVGMTMAHVRENYWIPRLRQLVLKVIKKCYGCRRFQAKALQQPPPGMLPLERTVGNHPFQAIGVDFAGPLKYKKSNKAEGKAYIVLYACSLTRAIYVELLATLSAQEFISSLKRFIARKGRPQKIFSDNGKTFVAADKWLKTGQKDKKVQNFLAVTEIH